LRTDDDGDKGKEKQRLVGHVPVRALVGNAHQLLHDEPNRDNEAGEETQHPHGSEEMHRPFTEFPHKKDGEQVQKTFDETPRSKFGGAILAWEMLDDLLVDAPEAGPFGNYGNVSMHLSINLNTL